MPDSARFPVRKLSEHHHNHMSLMQASASARLCQVHFLEIAGCCAALEDSVIFLLARSEKTTDQHFIIAASTDFAVSGKPACFVEAADALAEETCCRCCFAAGGFVPQFVAQFRTPQRPFFYLTGQSKRNNAQRMRRTSRSPRLCHRWAVL